MRRSSRCAPSRPGSRPASARRSSAWDRRPSRSFAWRSARGLAGSCRSRAELTAEDRVAAIAVDGPCRLPLPGVGARASASAPSAAVGPRATLNAARSRASRTHWSVSASGACRSPSPLPRRRARLRFQSSMPQSCGMADRVQHVPGDGDVVVVAATTVDPVERARPPSAAKAPSKFPVPPSARNAQPTPRRRAVRRQRADPRALPWSWMIVLPAMG